MSLHPPQVRCVTGEREETNLFQSIAQFLALIFSADEVLGGCVGVWETLGKAQNLIPKARLCGHQVLALSCLGLSACLE